MKLIRLGIMLVAALALTACVSPTSRPVIAARKPLILISIDGFRAEYVNRGVTPTLSRLATNGAHALVMRPSFPVLTYPNHYTLVTGLRPDHHGLVHNVIEDPAAPGIKFGLGDRGQVRDARWWDQAEPIWVTAQDAGLKANSLFWPGDEAAIHGVRPNRSMTFDQNMSANARVDLVLAWFAADHPDFTDLYFDDVDSAGHSNGPDSPELNQAIARVDAAITRLLAGLARQGLNEDQFNIIIVSDHGMVRADNLVMLDDEAKGTARVVTGGGTAMLEPLPGKEAAAKVALVGRHTHFTCWPKDQIPAQYHYGTNARVSPIVCLGDLGWYLTTHAAADGKTPTMGQHGFDPYALQMAALFVAHGPSVRAGLVLPVIDNVDVYPLVMRLLRLNPWPNDGDPNVSDSILNGL